MHKINCYAQLRLPRKTRPYIMQGQRPRQTTPPPPYTHTHAPKSVPSHSEKATKDLGCAESVIIFAHLKRAHEVPVHFHHSTSIVVFIAVVWGREESDQLSVCKELVPILHHLQSKQCMGQVERLICLVWLHSSGHSIIKPSAVHASWENKLNLHMWYTFDEGTCAETSSSGLWVPEMCKKNCDENPI